jgi:predicted dienelactone hydrolase
MKAVFVWMFALLTTVASAQTAPDATGSKPGVAVGSFEYFIPGITDTDVAPIPIDLWARVYLPSGYAGPLPVVVILHGNHATCGTNEGYGPARRDDNIQYTLTGTCPERYMVIPNHAGYDYLARPLASWGYVVVSINANRGVTAAPGEPLDRGLNLRRGRLVLRHFRHLVELNDTPTSPLYRKIDFSHVGLMGHSRGGEGMRAAYEQYRARLASARPSSSKHSSRSARWTARRVRGQVQTSSTPMGSPGPSCCRIATATCSTSRA